MQNGESSLVEKLQTSVATTIPTWKNQMTIALALHRQDEALKLQRHVSGTTNEMLRRTAEQLRVGTEASARPSAQSSTSRRWRTSTGSSSTFGSLRR